MTDFRGLVPRTPPEGLIDWARPGLETCALLYSCEWVPNYGLEAVLTDRVRKVRMVRVECSECCQVGYFGYVRTSVREHYGFLAAEWSEAGILRDGDAAACPWCGASARVCLASRRGWRVTDDIRCMSASVLDGPDGLRPLVLTGWRLRRMVRQRRGRVEDRTFVDPLEAYIFGRRDAWKVHGWCNEYTGGGYALGISSEWRQKVKWRETWGTCAGIYGLTEELLTGSDVPHCKLDRYMEPDGVHDDDRCPVEYMRLWQQHSAVETVVTAGAGHILNALLLEKVNSYQWGERNKTGDPLPLPALDLGRKRPSEILRLDRDELRRMTLHGWDYFHWLVYTRCKALGDRLIDEDMINLHLYGNKDIESLIGMAPLGKCLRYILRQLEYLDVLAGGYETLETDPEDVLEEHTDLATILRDYWDNAQTAKWDLNDPAVRWPRDLFEAHDGAMRAAAMVRDRASREAMAARYQELSRLAYASGSILIRPARSQGELNREGSKLEHCVARYGKDMAAGKTAIFFIRRPWAPEEPWYTLEWDEKGGRVLQNRGLRNCARTREIEAFEKEWVRWVRSGCKRKKDGTPRGAKPVISVDPAKALRIVEVA